MVRSSRLFVNIVVELRPLLRSVRRLDLVALLGRAQHKRAVQVVQPQNMLGADDSHQCGMRRCSGSSERSRQGSRTRRKTRRRPLLPAPHSAQCAAG